MDNFNEEMKATILRDFSSRVVELEGISHDWEWNNGVILFPEGLCPWCKESIQSHSIWRVKTNDGYHDLVGRWQLVDGVLLREPRTDHPHVKYSTGGTICVGSAGSVTAALFFGMNPADVFWRTEGRSREEAWSEWLRRVWDHDCAVISQPCAHTRRELCELRGCPLVWIGETPGCLCGCYCHPRSSYACNCRRASGHQNCHCGLPQEDAATPPVQPEPVLDLSELDEPESDEDEDGDEDTFVCDCDDVDHDCSDCCADYRNAEYRHNEGECDPDDCPFYHDD